MQDNPMDQVSVLREKVAEIANGLGLKLEVFMVIPGPVGGPHAAQAVFQLDPEVAFVSQESRDDKKQFDDLMRQQRVDDFEAQQKKIRDGAAGLISDLKSKDGIGLDAPISEILPEVTPEAEEEPEEEWYVQYQGPHGACPIDVPHMCTRDDG